MRALIVDDDYVVRTQLRALLARCGDFDCDGAANSVIAFDMFVAAHNEELPYDLITVDIEMPGQDGTSFVDRVRKWEEQNQLPKEKQSKIMMATVKSDLSNVAKAYYNLCQDYMTKPFDEATIKSKLKNLGLSSE